MAIKRQVSKKKLKQWIEENKSGIGETIEIKVVFANKLLEVIDSGELDMTKDWRVHKDE